MTRRGFSSRISAPPPSAAAESVTGSQDAGKSADSSAAPPPSAPTAAAESAVGSRDAEKSADSSAEFQAQADTNSVRREQLQTAQSNPGQKTQSRSLQIGEASCHACGIDYLMPHALYCMNCGEKRVLFSREPQHDQANLKTSLRRDPPRGTRQPIQERQGISSDAAHEETDVSAPDIKAGGATFEVFDMAEEDSDVDDYDVADDGAWSFFDEKPEVHEEVNEDKDEHQVAAASEQDEARASAAAELAETELRQAADLELPIGEHADEVEKSDSSSDESMPPLDDGSSSLQPAQTLNEDGNSFDESMPPPNDDGKLLQPGQTSKEDSSSYDESMQPLDDGTSLQPGQTSKEDSSSFDESVQPLDDDGRSSQPGQTSKEETITTAADSPPSEEAESISAETSMPCLAQASAETDEASWEARWRRRGFRSQREEKLPVAKEQHGSCHLDSNEALSSALKGERARHSASIEEKLSLYDECTGDQRKRFNSKYDCRDTYEMHLRGEASKELRAMLDRVTMDLVQEKLRRRSCGRHLDESVVKFVEPPTVILGLMAVHITTQKRLEKLMNTLQSIEAQDLAGVNAELHLGISWYTSDTTLAMKVQELFYCFIASRKAQSKPQIPTESAQQSSRAQGRNSFAKYLAKRQPDAASSSRTETGSSGPATVVIRQTKRHTQFQHYRAALSAIEAELRFQWQIRPDAGLDRSIWVIFGDDDDLWHPRRAAEFARAVQKHPDIEAVAAMATLTRAGIGLRDGQTSVPESALPDRAHQVDEFLFNNSFKEYVGENHANEEACQKYQKQLARDGGTDEPPPEDIFMEHFDYSPRLRILNEFFERTSEEILAHRFCDLRLCEYLETYPRFGDEFGLEISFFKPQCWMYFYRNQGINHESFAEGIEQSHAGDGEADLPDVLFAETEHVSTQVPISTDAINFATKHCSEFMDYDELMTQAKLIKHFACFRSMMEHYLVRLHTRKIDQRRLDGLVVAASSQSFGRFSTLVEESEIGFMCGAGQLLLSVCQTFAATLAKQFGVNIFWIKPDSVILPEMILLNGDSESNMQRKEFGNTYSSPGGAYPASLWASGKGYSKGTPIQHAFQVLPSKSPAEEGNDLIRYRWKIPGIFESAFR